VFKKFERKKRREKMRTIVVLLLLTLFFLFLIFSGCGMDVQSLVENQIILGRNSFENGDLEEAELHYTEVLKIDPNNAEANGAMAVINILKSLEDFSKLYDSIIELLPTELVTLKLCNTTQLFKKLINSKMNIEKGKILKLQDDIQNLIEKLEDISRKLEKALKGDFRLRFYPNEYDYDEDGKIEETEALKFEITYIDYTTQIVSTIDLYMGDIHLEKPILRIKTLQDGGDAWFDIEFIENHGNVQSIAFDDNDYIEIDKGEMYALSAAVNSLLSILKPIIIWNLEIPENLIEPINSFLSSSDLQHIIEIFDVDGNGTITNLEQKEILGDFLSFRSMGEYHLSTLRDRIIKSIDSIVGIVEEIRSDEIRDSHNLTNAYYIPISVLPSQEEIAEFLKLKKYLTEIPVELYIDEDIEPEYLKLYILFDNPKRFADLKDFLPDIDYTNGEFKYPDLTFGGIIEGIEPN